MNAKQTHNTITNSSILEQASGRKNTTISDGVMSLLSIHISLCYGLFDCIIIGWFEDIDNDIVISISL